MNLGGGVEVNKPRGGNADDNIHDVKMSIDMTGTS